MLKYDLLKILDLITEVGILNKIWFLIVLSFAYSLSLISFR